MSSSNRSSRLGLSHWDPYAMHRGGCLGLYYCNTVEWSWWHSGLARPTGFLQCFDTVDFVIWPVKIVPDMTYNVFGGTLNLAQSIHRIRVEFVYEGHRVKVKVTIAKWSQMPVHELINFHRQFWSALVRWCCVWLGLRLEGMLVNYISSSDGWTSFVYEDSGRPHVEE